MIHKASHSVKLIKKLLRYAQKESLTILYFDKNFFLNFINNIVLQNYYTFFTQTFYLIVFDVDEKLCH